MYISALTTTNFRSLRDFKLQDMKPVTIFHGPNNSGKSNILALLEIIFSSKLQGDGNEGLAPSTPNFWGGILQDFRDNFYRGTSSDISFEVVVTIPHAELARFHSILSLMGPALAKDRDKYLTLRGRISRLSAYSARMVLDYAAFQSQLATDAHVLFRRDSKVEFIPALSSMEVPEKQKSFEAMMNHLSDSFSVIEASRPLGREADPGQELVKLTPQTFKKWLLQQSLSRENYDVFRKLQEIFTRSPFNFGGLNFMREEDGELEVMLDRDKWRQPMSRLGSGYQQILYLFAAMVSRQGKMIGLEEIEINLSPEYQKHMFEAIKQTVHHPNGLMSQAIVTSHSPYFGGRGDVKCYEVSHDGEKTAAQNWSAAADEKFFPQNRGYAE